MFGWLKKKAAQRSLLKIELATRALVVISNGAYANIRVTGAPHPSDVSEIKKAQGALTNDIKLALAKGATFEEVRSRIELAKSKEKGVTQGAEIAIANVVGDIAAILPREDLDHNKNDKPQLSTDPKIAIALGVCRECGQQVSTEADTCPHCGAHHPTWIKPVAALGTSDGKVAEAKSGISAVSKLILVVILISVALIGRLFIRGPCESDWKKCVDNEQLVNSATKWAEVQGACKAIASGMARYGTPKWPPAPFRTFFAGNDYITSGKAVAIEPDAQFQNTFGATVHSRVTCTYDLQADQVIDVSISGVGISER